MYNAYPKTEGGLHSPYALESMENLSLSPTMPIMSDWAQCDCMCMLRRDCYVPSQNEPTFSSEYPCFTTRALHERARLFFSQSLCPARSRDILQPLLWSGVLVSTYQLLRGRNTHQSLAPTMGRGVQLWVHTPSMFWLYGIIPLAGHLGEFVNLVDEMETCGLASFLIWVCPAEHT